MIKKFLKRIFGPTKSEPDQIFIPCNSAGYGHIGRRPAQDLLRYVIWLDNVSPQQPRGPGWFWWWEREVNQLTKDLRKMGGQVINRLQAMDYIKQLNGVE